MSLEDISSVAQDYLKVIWSATEWGEAPISTKGLADRFGTTQANVSETLRRLANQQLMRYRPYKPAELTSRGTELAVAMVRRHRLIETFLVTSLGYGWDEVHDEAEHLEHAVSDLMIDRIDRLLGHPIADPHGDPIPGPDGALLIPPDTIPLPAAAPGTYTVVRISDADPQVLARLTRQNVAPGTHICVQQAPGSTPDTRITGPDGQPLTATDTATIRVRRQCHEFGVPVVTT